MYSACPSNPPKIPLFIWMFLVGQNERNYRHQSNTISCVSLEEMHNVETERISSPVLRHEVQSPHKGQRSGFIS